MQTLSRHRRNRRRCSELFVRFHNHKASRCEASTLKQVEWNLLPVIADMERPGIKNSTSRTECMMNAMLTLGVRGKF